MVNLGNIYEDREDFEKAYYWYLEAALADNEQETTGRAATATRPAARACRSSAADA